MKDRKYKPKEPNKVQLREVPTKLLRDAMHYMIVEVEACDAGYCPEQRPAFVALALTCARELRRRGKRVTLNLPTPPIGTAR